MHSSDRIKRVGLIVTYLPLQQSGLASLAAISFCSVNGRSKYRLLFRFTALFHFWSVKKQSLIVILIGRSIEASSIAISG